MATTTAPPAAFPRNFQKENFPQVDFQKENFPPQVAELAAAAAALADEAARLRAEVAACRREAERCREETRSCQRSFSALSDYLLEVGVLRASTLEARIHRHKFAAEKRKWPLKIEPSAQLNTVLYSQDMALDIGLQAGMLAFCALSAVSRQACRYVQQVLPCMQELRSHCVYVLGGWTSVGPALGVERYDPKAGRWEDMSPGQRFADGQAVAVVDGLLYVCGGMDMSPPALGTVGRFDPRVRKWEWNLPELQRARCFAAAGGLGGRLYVCGGEGFAGDLLASVEVFEPSTKSWDFTTPMTHGRCDAASSVLNRQLYVCGGRVEGSSSSSTGAVERYDPEAGRWFPVPPMAEPRRSAAVTVSDGRLYVCGGCSGAFALQSVERYDPRTDTWEAMPSMLIARKNAAATATEGSLYVFGGSGGQSGNAAAHFDPVTGTWTSLPPMSEERDLCSAVAVSSWRLP